MAKRKRDIPLLDFTNDKNSNWINDRLREHPEIISNGLYKLDDSSLHKAVTGKLEVISKPGKPKLVNKKIDWRAWFLYYNLCLLWGFMENYDSIAIMVDRSPITVKHEFILCAREIEINT